VSTTRSGASPAARGMENAADCPAANIVSNRSTAAFSLTRAFCQTAARDP
jgi:hypothetical protein